MISPVTVDDVSTIKAIAEAAILTSVTASDTLKQEIIEDTYHHIDVSLEEAGHTFLKYEDEGITGFILLRNGWNLSDLFVLPSQHGKGIGRALFAAARNKIVSEENRGYIRVNSSLNAVNFYHKLGFKDFKPEHPCPDFVVPLIHTLPMQSLVR